MRTRLALGAAILTLVLMQTAGAVPINVTGADLISSRSTPDTSGVVASGVIHNLGWSQANGGFRISWNIAFNGITNTWHYVYDISGNTYDASAQSYEPLSKGLSHWILEVSPTITDDNVDDLIFNESTSFELNDYTATSEGNSNPDLPGTLHGIKFDGGSSTGPVEFSFDSVRQPVWGDFYAKDGVYKYPAQGPGTQYPVTAWNTGIGTDPTGSPFTNWIPTPDTEDGSGPPQEVIPEPATLALLGLGGLSLIGRRTLKRK